MQLSSLIVRLTLDMAGIILTAAGLGFLGLGAQPPAPEWGAMISTGRHTCSTMVGRDDAGPRHLRRQPRLQPAGRRPARRARPEAAVAVKLGEMLRADAEDAGPDQLLLRELRDGLARLARAAA